MTDRATQFTTLYADHESRLIAFALSLTGRREAAEEVVQEAAVVLWKKFDTFEIGTDFFAWSARVIRLEVFRYRRRHARDRLRFDEAFFEAVADETEAMARELAERRHALDACVNKLGDADRHLVHERYERGELARRVAERLGRSADAVYKALGRIRKSLQDCVTRTLEGDA